MIVRNLLLVLVLALWGLSACSSGDSDENAAVAETTAEASSQPTEADVVAAQAAFYDEGRAGRWSKVRSGDDAGTMTEAQRRQIRRLESLGYVGGTRLAPTMKSVVVHDPERAWAGLNFFTSGHAPEALLMDMDGQVLHRWALGYWHVWPDSDVERDHRGTQHWRRARILPGGDLLAIYEGLGIVKLDRHSHLIWANPCHAHHDLEVQPDGDILVLAREAHVLPRVHPRSPILEDFILRLSADGQIKQRVSILEAFENSDEYRYVWEQSRSRQGDVFHTNSIEMLDGRIADRAPAFTAGRVLISIRNLDVVAVVDLERVEVVWAFQERFKQQHDATILPDGNLMLFNNRTGDGASSINVYDPATRARGWRYRGSTEDPFYSRTCGTNQMLPNGNVLITESDNGRAFEIDPAGQKVWEFFNPNRVGTTVEYIATLFEVLRLPADYPVDWAITPK